MNVGETDINDALVNIILYIYIINIIDITHYKYYLMFTDTISPRGCICDIKKENVATQTSVKETDIYDVLTNIILFHIFTLLTQPTTNIIQYLLI